MPIVSHVKLMATIPIDVAQRVIETWRRSLQEEAPDMYAKILSRIPDEKRFVERIGQGSHDGYRPTLDPDFISKSGQGYEDIQSGQASNLKMSYKKYAEKLQHLFETVDGIAAKRFKELVERMKNAYALGVTQRTLPFTGTKIEGRGLAPLAALWLVKDIGVLDQLRIGDKVLEGGPFRICRPQEVPTFKAALTGRLIQGGASIVKANYAEDIIKSHNDRTNRLVQGFIDPALGLKPFATGTESHVDFILEDNQLFLDVKVSTV